jgi:uncharacterized membrane protein
VTYPKELPYDEEEGGLSYQEKSIIVSLAASLLVYVVYSFILYRRYQAGSYDSVDAARFLGTAILVLIGVQIVMQIIAQIMLAIGSAVVTVATTGQEPTDPPAEDERDKLIELKASRNSFIVFGIGFVLSMVALAMGLPATVTLAVLIGFMMLAELLGTASKLAYYRRGV